MAKHFFNALICENSFVVKYIHFHLEMHCVKKIANHNLDKNDVVHLIMFVVHLIMFVVHLIMFVEVFVRYAESTYIPNGLLSVIP